MFNCRTEPSLQDMLSDPLIQTVMAAYGADGRQLQAMAREVMRQREAHRRGEKV